METLFELVDDAVPHNPNRVFLSGDHKGGITGYICATPEAQALTHLHRHYFGGPGDDRSHYRFGAVEPFFDGAFQAKTVWKGEDLYHDSFYRSEGFEVVFKPLGYRTLVSVNFSEDGKLLGSYPVWRGPDQKPFSREDLAFFAAIAPHVSHGLKMANARAACDENESFLPSALWGAGIVVMDLFGKVLAVDDRAGKTFAQLEGLDGIHRGAFHDRLTTGLEHIGRTLAGIFGKDAMAMSPPVTRVFQHWSGLALRLRGVLAAGSDGRRYVTVVVECGESLNQRRERFAARWGLSTREMEVLELVAGGKTNREIGTILGLSALTVKKHLEHILLSLEVETRTAATAMFWEDCSSGSQRQTS